MEIHLKTTGCSLPDGITQCYLPPDTKRTHPTLTPASEGLIIVLDLPTPEG